MASLQLVLSVEEVQNDDRVELKRWIFVDKR